MYKHLCSLGVLVALLISPLQCVGAFAADGQEAPASTSDTKKDNPPADPIYFGVEIVTRQTKQPEAKPSNPSSAPLVVFGDIIQSPNGTLIIPSTTSQETGKKQFPARQAKPMSTRTGGKRLPITTIHHPVVISHAAVQQEDAANPDSLSPAATEPTPGLHVVPAVAGAVDSPKRHTNSTKTVMMRFNSHVCDPAPDADEDAPAVSLHPVVVGVIGAAKQQTSEIVCVPGDNSFMSTPYFLTHYALEKLAGGMSDKALDHLQVMVIRTPTVIPNKPEIYRITTDWPKIAPWSSLANQKLLNAKSQDLVAVYITVDGLTDAVGFAMFKDIMNGLMPAVSSFTGAIVGASIKK